MTEEQIIANEMEKLQRAMGGAAGDETEEDRLQKQLDSEQEVYKALSAPFPDEALSKDSSRGFDLTSVKAQYVVERLNDVLGVMNWTFGGEFKETEEGVMYMGALVITINGRQNRQFAPGYAKVKKNLGDTYKSAHTDSLSKCASKFGVANDVFKGKVAPPGKTTTKRGAALTAKTEAPKERSAEAKKPSSFARRRGKKSL